MCLHLPQRQPHHRPGHQVRLRLCVLVVGFGAYTHARRFILADTDRLHRKIAEMSDRIRHLEDGLAILQSSVTRDPHPLLAPDLLKIKSGLELHSAAEGLASLGSERIERDAGADPDDEPAYIDAFGTLAVRDDGAATFYGRSAGSEVRLGLPSDCVLGTEDLAESSSGEHLFAFSLT